MKKTVTLSKVKEIYLSLDSIGKEDVSRNFAYAVSKNKLRLNEDFKSIQEAESVLVEFDQKRKELCEKYSDKDVDGNPLIEDETYVGLTNNISFKEKFEELKEKYKPQIKELEDLYNKEIEIDFYMIDFKEVPERITPYLMDRILIFTKDKDSE